MPTRGQLGMPARASDWEAAGLVGPSDEQKTADLVRAHEEGSLELAGAFSGPAGTPAEIFAAAPLVTAENVKEVAEADCFGRETGRWVPLEAYLASKAGYPPPRLVNGELRFYPGGGGRRVR